MIQKLRTLVGDDGLKARAMRGSFLTIVNFGFTNLFRLVSNLLLTRLLFPEAFGLMALVYVVIGGLKMFSDLGANQSIMQNPRGDDPNFLNTAWTFQIIRGVFLWLLICAIAPFAADFYGDERLAQLLPVAGFSALILGFMTTKGATASRHLRVGRQTLLAVITQLIGLAVTLLLANQMRSVWALVYGSLIAAVIQVIVFHMFMPGLRNRIHWEWDAAKDLFHFGKYIFLSTIAGFLINQGDKAVLGAFLSLADLGIYNIGALFGTLPVVVARALANRVVMPLYRMKDPSESDQNRLQIRKARRLLVAVCMVVTFLLSYGGIFLVETLYDSRYLTAGPIIALFGLVAVPLIALSGYDGALLARGDSRRFFILLAVTAVIQMTLMYFAVRDYGVIGAIASPAIAAFIAYPLRLRFLNRYKASDISGDIAFIASGFLINGIAVWWHWETISQLITV